MYPIRYIPKPHRCIHPTPHPFTHAPTPIRSPTHPFWQKDNIYCSQTSDKIIQTSSVFVSLSNITISNKYDSQPAMNACVHAYVQLSRHDINYPHSIVLIDIQVSFVAYQLRHYWVLSRDGYWYRGSHRSYWADNRGSHRIVGRQTSSPNRGHHRRVNGLRGGVPELRNRARKRALDGASWVNEAIHYLATRGLHRGTRVKSAEFKVAQ